MQFMIAVSTTLAAAESRIHELQAAAAIPSTHATKDGAAVRQILCAVATIFNVSWPLGSRESRGVMFQRRYKWMSRDASERHCALLSNENLLYNKLS